MSKPKILFHDVEKDEAIEREMTDLEYEIYLEREKLLQNEFVEEENKKTIRLSALAKLTALGLTEEEIAAL